MNPVLNLGVGPLVVATSSYRFFFVLAAATTLLLGMAVATRRGLPWRPALALLALTAAAVPVGARLMDLATKTDFYREDPGRIASLDFTGFSMFGGLMLAAAVGVVACRGLGLLLGRTADSVAPALGVGLAIMRIGCFEAGCCFGKESDLPWAVTFPAGSEAHLYQLVNSGRLIFGGGPPRPVHPTELYEMLAALIAAVLAGWLIRGRAPDGVAFLAGVCWFSLFRLVNHNLRVPGGALVVPDWFYPALYLCLFLVAGAAMVRLAWRTPWPSPASLEPVESPR